MWSKIIISILLIVMPGCLLASDIHNGKKMSADFQAVNVQDALHILAKFLNLNMVISPDINGVVSLHLNKTTAQETLDMLLASHHLTKWQVGSVWFIASQDEWLQRKQEELKLRTAADESAQLITRVWQIRYAKADEVAHILQDGASSLLSVRGHVRSDLRTNVICVQDIATRMQQIDFLIKRLDVPVQQVKIEARLASVDQDAERQLGVAFNVQSSAENSSQHSSGAPLYSLAVAKLADGSLLDVQLAVLEREGHGELISSPSLFTANQQTASIESGEEIPYQEVSLSGGTSVSFKKAVLSLKVTPQILPGNKVLLQLQINQDKPSKHTVLGVPAISTRQMTTRVLVNNGQTIVLGGIYETNKEEGEAGIPYLNKIPLLGVLFRQQNVVQNKRQLVIFVTPQVIG